METKLSLTGCYSRNGNFVMGQPLLRTYILRVMNGVALFGSLAWRIVGGPGIPDLRTMHAFVIRGDLVYSNCCYCGCFDGAVEIPR